MRMAGLTDVGRVRARNEDAIDWDEQAAVAMVADGMGGHPAGDVASQLAVTSAMDVVRRESEGGRWLDAGGSPAHTLELANVAIFEHGARRPEHLGMGTTGVLAAFGEHRGRIGHVGDSRAYHLSGGRLSQLTRDHTAAQQAVDQQLITHEQARETPERHQLTRALGLERQVQADVIDVRPQRGDVFALCSDGLTEMVEDDTIRQVLEENVRDPEHAAKLLLRLALENGGVDNISVVVIVIT